MLWNVECAVELRVCCGRYVSVLWNVECVVEHRVCCEVSKRDADRPPFDSESCAVTNHLSFLYLALSRGSIIVEFSVTYKLNTTDGVTLPPGNLTVEERISEAISEVLNTYTEASNITVDSGTTQTTGKVLDAIVFSEHAGMCVQRERERVCVCACVCVCVCVGVCV